MMRILRSVLPPGLLAAFAAGILLTAGPIQAQRRPISAGEGGELIPLRVDWHKDRDEYNQFLALKKGEQPLDRSSEEILEHGAQWYAYRLTDVQYQEPKLPTSRGMHDLVKEALEQILDPHDTRRPLNPTQVTFAEEFNRRLAARLHEVVKNSKLIARLNAAILLARLAATGQQEAGDILAEVIADPKENDAVKYYALKGLGDLFVLTHGDSPLPVKKEREASWITALMGYLDHKYAVRDDTPKDELDAISFIRIEAVKALGQTRYPAATRVEQKRTIIERPAAWLLLRVVRREGFTPPPELKEQVQAVVALSRLQSKLCDEYQPDYVAYHIAQFLVEFAGFYENRAAEEQQSTVKRPWKVYAAQMSQALDDWLAELDAPPRSAHYKYVADMMQQAKQSILVRIMGLQGTDANSFIGYLQNNPPKSTSVFRGMPQAVVKEGERVGG